MIECNAEIISILRTEYSNEEFIEFIESLNFHYDNGFGAQELFGTIWYKDGSWSDRREYDGREWWEHHHRPDIPDNLEQFIMSIRN